jgi:predicted metal-dependent hydrolase
VAVKPSIILTEAAKEKAMKAKAYIESKYRKMDTQERERNEGKLSLSIFNINSLGNVGKKDEPIKFE